MRTLAILVATWVALSLPQSAHAQSAQDKAAADVLFREGKRLLQAGKAAEACPKFVESNRLDSGIGTMLWLADCYDRLGKTASAWGQFQEAAEFAARQKDTRERVARQRAASLEPKLVKLVVNVASEVPGIEVTRDGTVLGKALWGTATPVDPGTHAVAATAPGYKPWASTVDAGTGPTTITVSIPKLDVEPSAPPPPVVVATEPEREGRGAAQRIVGVSIAGLGVVGVALGVVFGLSAKSKLDDSNADGHCKPDNHCDATGFGLRNEAKDAATLSTIGFVAGGVALVGGTIVYLTAPRAKPKSGSVRVLPSFALTGAGWPFLGVSGAF